MLYTVLILNVDLSSAVQSNICFVITVPMGCITPYMQAGNKNVLTNIQTFNPLSVIKFVIINSHPFIS